MNMQLKILFDEAKVEVKHTYKVVDADTIMFDGVRLRWFFAFNYYKARNLGVSKLNSLKDKKCRHCWLWGFLGGAGFAQNCKEFQCCRDNGDCGFYSIREFPNKNYN